MDPFDEQVNEQIGEQVKTLSRGIAENLAATPTTTPLTGVSIVGPGPVIGLAGDSDAALQALLAAPLPGGVAHNATTDGTAGWDQNPVLNAMLNTADPSDDSSDDGDNDSQALVPIAPLPTRPEDILWWEEMGHDAWRRELDEGYDGWGAASEQSIRQLDARRKAAEERKWRKREAFHVIKASTPTIGEYLDETYKDVKRGMPQLGETVKAGMKDYDQTDALASDVFRALWNVDPEEQEADEKVAYNRDALHGLLETTEFQQLHVLTERDEFAAGMAASNFTENLVKVILEHKAQEPQPSEGNGGQGDGQGGAGQGYGQGQGGGAGQGTGQGKWDDGGAAMRQAARQAAREAMNHVIEANAAIEGLCGQLPGHTSPGGNIGWGTSGGRSKYMGDMKARARLAKELSKDGKLRTLIELAGRMKRIAASVQRNKHIQRPEEYGEVTTGNHLPAVVAGEYANLALPQTTPLFYQKFAERRLMQYELVANAREGRGPIVLLIDESGSMDSRVTPYASNASATSYGARAAGGARVAQTDNYTRLDWAKGVLLALLAVARTQKRDLRLIEFSDYYNCKVTDFAKGQQDPDTIVKAALHDFGGGTDYNKPMQEALAAIAESRYKKADVIWITDGECHGGKEMTHRWHEAKRDKEFKSLGVLIGGEYGDIGERAAQEGSLANLCDGRVMDFSGRDQANEIKVLEEMFDV